MARNDATAAAITCLGDLKPDKRNARRHTPRGVGMIVDAMHEVGAARSIVIDEENTILAGNATVEAAGEAGIERVRVVEADGNEIIAVRRRGLTPEQKTRLALWDNRAAEFADWNAEEIERFIAEDVNLDGIFTGDELAAMFASEEAEEDDDFDADEVAASIVEPTTKPGDLYLLGRHRLLCGDATNVQHIERLMGGELADMVFTDPPYNVDYTGKTKDALKIGNDHMGGDAFRDFLRASFAGAYTAAKTGAPIYVCHADTEGLNFRTAFMEAGWSLRQVLVWVKQQFVMGRQDYHWRHEPILYGWKEGAAHTWCGDRKQSTVLEFDRPTRSVDHPTTKPIGLVAYAIGNSSTKGSVVLDLFGGSGSTLIAADQIGRRAYLSELDPKYCDVIVKRWEALTGDAATLENATN